MIEPAPFKLAFFMPVINTLNYIFYKLFELNSKGRVYYYAC
ncbi:hypothetical protein X564_12085 [Pseudoalteromonas agarivorans]|nr:hypothetical protein X564_12085 [Pseudoalteromonas agarivorans]